MNKPIARALSATTVVAEAANIGAAIAKRRAIAIDTTATAESTVRRTTRGCRLSTDLTTRPTLVRAVRTPGSPLAPHRPGDQIAGGSSSRRPLVLGVVS